MLLNLVHWNLLHSNKFILPTFSGQTPHFLGENHKTRPYNLQHRKPWSDINKKGGSNFFDAVALYLARPHRLSWDLQILL